MSSTTTHEHPGRNEAVQLMRSGASNAEVIRQLRMSSRTVALIRSSEGIGPARKELSLAEKLEQHIVPVDAPGGHSVWSGRRNNGTPVIRHQGREYPAASVAFQERTGRKPEGNAQSDCDGHPQCMTPEHILDSIERTRVRAQLRALMGHPGMPDTCKSGHDQSKHGRLTPGLAWYCSPCNTKRKPKKGN